MLRLHWSPDSANLVVRIALMRLGLAFEPVRVDRAANGLRSPAYLALNPQGLLPVLEDGDAVWFETGAILLHLAERTGRLGPRAGDPAHRAAFLRWLFYLSNTVHADLRVAFYSHRYVPAEAAPALRAGLRTRVGAHLDLLEREIARTGALTGPEPTLVDDYLGVCVRWSQNYPAAGPLFEGLGARPALTGLLSRLEVDAPVIAACRSEFIEDARPYTAPERPALPAGSVTG